MDGPISTNETSGSFQQAASVTFRSPSVGAPEKVPPVTEGDRSRSSRRDETGQSEKMNRNPTPQDQKAEIGRQATAREPAYFVELGPTARDEPLSADRVSADRLTNRKEAAEAEPAKGRETIPLTGTASSPPPSDVLADALADAKARWAEVNREALQSGILPGRGEPVRAEGVEVAEDPSSPPVSDSSTTPAEGRGIAETGRTHSPAEVRFPSEALDSAAPSGQGSRGVEADNGLQRQLTSRYENMATSLSNPHPTQPIVDLFV